MKGSSWSDALHGCSSAPSHSPLRFWSPIFLQVIAAWLHFRRASGPSTWRGFLGTFQPNQGSDAKLKEYFDYLFPGGIIERVYIVKKLSSLAALLDEFSIAEQRLHESQYLWFLANKD